MQQADTNGRAIRIYLISAGIRSTSLTRLATQKQRKHSNRVFRGEAIRSVRPCHVSYKTGLLASFYLSADEVCMLDVNLTG